MDVRTPWQENAGLPVGSQPPEKIRVAPTSQVERIRAALPPTDEAARFEIFRQHVLLSIDVKLRELHGPVIRITFSDHIEKDAEIFAERMIAAIPTASAWDERVGPFYAASTVGTLLGISRQAVHKRMQRRQLLGLSVGSDVVYPVFQFRGADPTPYLHEVLTRLDPEDRDRWGDALWLQTPLGTEHGPTPVDLLWADDAGPTARARNLSRVLEEASDAGAVWAS